MLLCVMSDDAVHQLPVRAVFPLLRLKSLHGSLGLIFSMEFGHYLKHPRFSVELYGSDTPGQVG